MAVTVTFFGFDCGTHGPLLRESRGGLTHLFFSWKEDIFLINDSTQLFTELFLTFEIGI